MRVQTEEWRRFVPGARMYNGEKTLFYNGEILGGEDLHYNRHPLIYDQEERNSWKVIMVLPGVEIIPYDTFKWCSNVETVIMSDSVRRIENEAFSECSSLKFIKLSRNLEYIGWAAFNYCSSLISIFIPPSCREIDGWAFQRCERLLILGLSQDVQLREKVCQKTALIKKSPLQLDERGEYENDDEAAAVQWIKSINEGEAYALHRACSSFNPLSEVIHTLVQQQGLGGMRVPNAIGITPSQYLAANTFADISEKEISNRYILEMMGEVL